MSNLQLRLQAPQSPFDIRIELVDESGKHLDPNEVGELDYLARFQHKCVVNKVYRDMIASRKTGIIEVYQDKVIIKEN